MSRFYVGQRVRVARSTRPYGPVKGRSIVLDGMLGTEATVVGTVSSPNAGFRERGAFDTSIRLENGVIGMCPSACLEPITDSYDKSTWDQCVWKPEHLRFGV